METENTPQKTAKEKETESGEAKKRQAKGDKEGKYRGLMWKVTDYVCSG